MLVTGCAKGDICTTLTTRVSIGRGRVGATNTMIGMTMIGMTMIGMTMIGMTMIGMTMVMMVKAMVVMITPSVMALMMMIG